MDLETYIFQPDRAGRLIADALIAAAHDGVEVRLLVDAWGSKFKGLKEFDDAGVEARKYSPGASLSIHKIGRRTHRKILVVDGRIAYTGGLGIDERWLGNARNTKEWRDTQVRVEGPVVAQMQAIFSEDWTFTTGEILTGSTYYPAIEPAGSTLAQAVKASLGDATSLSKMLYYVAIESATRSIYIQNAYFLPDKQVRQALVDAAETAASTFRSWFRDGTSTCRWCARHRGATTASCSRRAFTSGSTSQRCSTTRRWSSTGSTPPSDRSTSAPAR